MSKDFLKLFFLEILPSFIQWGLQILGLLTLIMFVTFIFEERDCESNLKVDDCKYTATQGWVADDQ